MSDLPQGYKLGAQLLRSLQQLRPGERYRMTSQMLSEIEVPAHPLSRQTPEFIANWMRERLDFYSVLEASAWGNWWEIVRPGKDASQEKNDLNDAYARGEQIPGVTE
jgi:hypothetical protein